MAMDGSQMGTEVVNAIINASATPEAKAACLEFWGKVCTAIVGHITANAEVPAGIAVKTEGSPTTQTGSTTAPGSVT
jgi:hypothetical protein